MKKLSLIALFVCLNTHLGFAGWRLYGGGNGSTLNTISSYYRARSVAGVDKTWEKNWYGLSFGAQYIERSSLMTDLIKLFPMTNDGYHLDVLFSVRYIELPLLCAVRRKAGPAVHLLFNFGPSLGISMGDHSKPTYGRALDSQNRQAELDNAKHIYYEFDDPGDFYRAQQFSGIFMNAGFTVEYHKVFAELRYSHGITAFEHLYGLAMHDEKFRTFEFLLGVYLKNRDNEEM
jgi:hypothetical protein